MRVPYSVPDHAKRFHWTFSWDEDELPIELPICPNCGSQAESREVWEPGDPQVGIPGGWETGCVECFGEGDLMRRRSNGRN